MNPGAETLPGFRISGEAWVTEVLSIRWEHVEGFRRLDRALRDLGNDQMRKVANRAINRAGDMARSKVATALARQTGLSRNKYILPALKRGTKRSSWETLAYSMTLSGGDVPLKFFDPKEVEGGVAARTFGRQTLYPGAFIRGGEFPNHRVTLKSKDNVMVRMGEARNPITRAKSGVVVPAEMVKGETAKAFEQSVADNLPRRLEHEIGRATGGVFS